MNLKKLTAALPICLVFVVGCATRDPAVKAAPAQAGLPACLGMGPGIPSHDPGDYRASPIPVSHDAPSTVDSHVIRFEGDTPYAREKLVDAQSRFLAGESYYARQDGNNPPYKRALAGALPKVWVRKSVAGMLVAANERLKRYNVEVYLLDGFRPIACQKELWAYFVSLSRREHPQAGESDLNRYAARYCSNPAGFKEDDYRTWTLHITGGAVDVTLRDRRTGNILDMGTAFDDGSPAAHVDALETGKPGHPNQAQVNRRLLYWAMIDSGFTSYPYEWWHYDFGDQMYVLYCRPKPTELRELHCVYGPAALPSEKPEP